MSLSKVLAALSSDLRREILKCIVEKPSTVAEVLNELGKRGFVVKYRETVYRALEKLVAAGLAEKYYEKNRGLCYKTTVSRIIIDLSQGTMTCQPSERT